MLPVLFDEIERSREYVIRADSSRPELISYLKRNGFRRTVSVKKWQGAVEDGIDFMKSFAEIIIHPDCTNTLEEFKLYSYKVDKKSGDILPELLDKYNHCIDAIRYALEPIILGKGKKINARPELNVLNSIGQEIPVSRVFQEHLWIS
jgi:phage terminase large subunit